MTQTLPEEVLSSRDSMTDAVEVGTPARSGALPHGAPEDAADGGEDEVIVFPATAAQRRFWLLDQLVPGGNPALTMPLAIRLRGNLDVFALEKAFNEVIRRHEALRTTFHYEGGELLQVISPLAPVDIPLLNVPEVLSDSREAVLTRLLAEEARRPFSLATGPLVRGRLVRLGPHEHLLLCPVHHIVADGWSNGIFVRELGSLYAASLEGKPSPLPELAVHFADFSEWQNDLVESGGFQDQTAYWRGKLGGELPVLDLPTDGPRLPWRGKAIPAEIAARPLSEATANALKALCAREGCSPFIVMLTVFGLLLNRYTGGQEDLLVATSTANRQRLELENVIGLFVNPLLLRLDLVGATALREVLGRVRRVVLEAFENSDLPFEKMLEEVQPRRLQVNFLYQQDFVQAARWPGLEVAPEEPGSGGAVYEWNVIALEDGAGLRLHCEYNADLFKASTIVRMLADFEALLTAALAEGGLDVPFARLPLGVVVGASPEGTGRLVADRWRLPDDSVAWLDEHFEAAVPAGLAFHLPLSGRQVEILDGHDQPAPVGVPGELCIARSVAAPTWLKTGDIAVRRDNGDVEWIGPSGTECKVNGLRVDRSQIETALRRHPHVARALVVWREGERDEPILTAYYEGDGAPRALLAPREIRGFLQEHLPDDWVPAVCILVDRFPETPDGRLDAGALPWHAGPAKEKSTHAHDIPYLTLHHQIIVIWRELLKVRSVSIRDDFFALGGNSLLAMRMLHRVEEAFGKAILPATLFRRATVENLADEILKQDDDGASREVVHVQENGTCTPIFFLHGDIAGGGFYCAKLSRDLGPDQPFYALPPVEVDRPLEDRPTIEGMAAAHVAVIRSVRPHGPYMIGGFCIGGVIAYEVASQLVREGETVEKLFVIDAGPTHRRLTYLRAAVERLARWRGLDKNRQLYLFCRWYHWLARWDQRRKLSWRENAATLLQRVGRRWRHRRANAHSPAMTLHDDTPTSWFDARLDVPLVFLWALGAYRPHPYPGAMTLMLSSDLIGGAEGGNPAPAWRRFASNLEVVELAGDHLACITEHVSGLAAMMRRCLEGSR